MELAEFLDTLPVTETFKELTLKRHKNGHEYHTAKGSSWENWPSDRFVIEDAKEALDMIVWTWQVCERLPIFIHLAPKMAEVCSEFITLIECTCNRIVLDNAADYP